LIGNWSFNNGYIGSFTTAGNGDGYKLGPYNGNTTTISRFLFLNLAVGNRLIGFDMNYNSSNQYPVALYNNTGYNNLTYNFYFGFGETYPIPKPLNKFNEVSNTTRAINKTASPYCQLVK